MSELENGSRDFIGYEYKELHIEDSKVSLYMDGYENFGWKQDENVPPVQKAGQTIIRLKRDRKILNKVELTRLQRNFEACVNEISVMEKAGESAAKIWSLVIGIIGTAFMAGATFAAVHEPPLIALCIILAIPGFAGWIFPYFIYNQIKSKKEKELAPLIDRKYDEIYDLCEKGSKLM